MELEVEYSYGVLKYCRSQVDALVSGREVLRPFAILCLEIWATFKPMWQEDDGVVLDRLISRERRLAHHGLPTLGDEMPTPFYYDFDLLVKTGKPRHLRKPKIYPQEIPRRSQSLGRDTIRLVEPWDGWVDRPRSFGRVDGDSPPAASFFAMGSAMAAADMCLPSEGVFGRGRSPRYR